MSDERFQVNDNVLHIHGDEGDWEVWLNTDIADYDGLCVGCGESRKEAVADAIKVFEQGILALRGQLPLAAMKQKDKGK